MAETTQKSNNYGLAIVGGVSAMTGIALQVKPEDAVSNLSLWLEFFGVDRVPQFLATTQADTWGTVIGLALAALSFSIWWKRRNYPTKSASGIWLQGHGLDHAQASLVESPFVETKFFPQGPPKKRSTFDRLINGSWEDASAKVLADKAASEETERAARHAYEIEKARQKAIEEAAQKHSIGRAMAEIHKDWLSEKPPRRDRFAEMREDRRLKQLETDRHRRSIISAGRDIVHRYREAEMQEPFDVFVTRERAYLDIKPHLDNDYWKGVLGRSELNGVQDETARSDYEAGMFEREIARLEKEWQL